MKWHEYIFPSVVDNDKEFIEFKFEHFANEYSNLTVLSKNDVELNCLEKF